MKTISLQVATFLFGLVGLPASAQLAVATVNELAQDASGIYLINVEQVADPKWTDETGQRVLVANSTIERAIKGRKRMDLAVAFQPNVSDRAKFAAGGRYLVFVYGAESALVVAQQTAALPIQGVEVDTSALRGEPKSQPLSSVLSQLGV